MRIIRTLVIIVNWLIWPQHAKISEASEPRSCTCRDIMWWLPARIIGLECNESCFLGKSWPHGQAMVRGLHSDFLSLFSFSGSQVLGSSITHGRRILEEGEQILYDTFGYVGFLLAEAGKYRKSHSFSEQVESATSGASSYLRAKCGLCVV